MKWIRARVVFDAEDPESAAALIAEIFHDLGTQGVIMETAETDPKLDWAEDALPAPAQNAVTGFFPDDRRLEDNRRLLAQGLARLRAAGGICCRLRYSDIDEQDWAESWKTHFHPVRVSEKLVIKPTWRQYRRLADEIVIELDPGMAFGTGTHPTTVLCLRLIERYVRPGMRVLDIGTGSGILLIAAAKLGADRLAGIDCDPVAVGIARQNLLLNAIPGSRFRVETGDLVASVAGPFDLAAANILTRTIVAMIPDIVPLLADQGFFICSGITVSGRDTVLDKLAACGFEVLEVLTQEDWTAIAAKKSGAGDD